jgi:hypothetical protein
MTAFSATITLEPDMMSAPIAELSVKPSGSSAPPATGSAMRFPALKEAIAGAPAMTCGPGIAEAGDRESWELLGTAVDRAGTHLAALATIAG